MQELLNTAMNAARSASQIILTAWQNPSSFQTHEKAPKDLVTEIDKAVEKHLISCILQQYPMHSILSEEQGLIAGNDFMWIIDPIDGTSNFSRGLPHFAISIAVKKGGESLIGVIYDPVRQEMFTAMRKKGAYVNNQSIMISNKTNFDHAMIATGFPSKRQQFFPALLDCLRIIFPDVLGIRRAGAATLDLAYVAAGRLDAYFEFDVREWDVAAGQLLIEEAGGKVMDISGDIHFPQHGILAGTPGLTALMVKQFNPIWQNQLKELFANLPPPGV